MDMQNPGVLGVEAFFKVSYELPRREQNDTRLPLFLADQGQNLIGLRPS